MMCNVFTGCFNQMYSATGVKASDFQTLQLECGSQVNPIAGYLTSPDNTTVHTELPIAMLHKQSSASGPDQFGDPPCSPPQVEVQATTEAHTEPLRASPMPKIPQPPSGPDEAGDPTSLPPQVEVQATTGTHTEPLGASPMTKMPKPANASITTVKHKKSSASTHEVADRPSLPNQDEGPDTTCDTIGAHTEPPRVSPTIVEHDATIEPNNPTINRAKSTLAFDTTTLVQQTRESTIRPGNHVTEHDETSNLDNEILAYSPGKMHSLGEFDLNSTVMTSMPTSSSSPHPSDAQSP